MSRQFFFNFKWGYTGEIQEMFADDGLVVFRQGAELGHIQDAELVDLGGQYVLPAFIDSHCHILPTGLDLAKLQLGACQTPEEILDAVRDRDLQLDDGAWLLAVHYDQTKFPNAAHMTRESLDACIPDRPVVLRHSNGHAGVANSAALQLAGIGPDTPDPRGGTFVRDAAGQLSGVLLETALEKVLSASPKPDLEAMVSAIMAAAEKMAQFGIVAASDMMTGFLDLETELEAYRLAAERGCPIDLRLYLQWSAVLGHRGVGRAGVDAFSASCAGLTKGSGPSALKVSGLKIFADGAIGSATAAIHGRFLTTGGDGQLIYAPDRLREMVRLGHDAGFSIAVHSIGDRSTDLVMDAFEAVSDPSRHRIEHVMLMSDAQIERLAKLGCPVTMQPEFLKRFAHSYRRQLPEKSYRQLERFRSVWKAGIPMALNSDRPIVPGDPWDGILTASCRPEGFDPSENLDRMDAIRAYTEKAALLNGDRALEASLDSGSPVSFCVYSEDPVTADRPMVGRLFRRGAESAMANI